MTPLDNECSHLTALRAFLTATGLQVYSEHGEDGWVNVHCPVCSRTMEVILQMREPEEDGPEEEAVEEPPDPEPTHEFGYSQDYVPFDTYKKLMNPKEKGLP